MVTAEHVACDLGITVATVRRMVKDDQLPRYALGGELRFRLSEVRAAVELLRRPPRPDGGQA